MKKININLIKPLGNFLTPIIYLFVWFIFIKLSTDYLSLKLLDNDLYLVLSFLILLFGLIAKSTSWSIGHEKFGAKGDSRARVINFHGSEHFWFDLFADNPEILKEKKLIDLIDRLVKLKNTS